MASAPERVREILATPVARIARSVRAVRCAARVGFRSAGAVSAQLAAGGQSIADASTAAALPSGETPEKAPVADSARRALGADFDQIVYVAVAPTPQTLLARGTIAAVQSRTRRLTV